MWRQAKFHCRCPPSNSRAHHNVGNRAFCTSCSFLIFYSTTGGNNPKCQGCNTNDPWQQPHLPCISCQIATIIYRNPLQNRINKQLEYWLSTEDSSIDSTGEPSSQNTICTSIASRTHTTSTPDLLRLRQQSFERSYQEAKNRGSVEQTKFVFEDLSLLQNGIRSHHSEPKSTSHHHVLTSPPSETAAHTSSSRKRKCNDTGTPAKSSVIQKPPHRPPLLPIDTNSMTTGTASTLTQDNSCVQIGNKRRNKQARTLRMKEIKKARSQQTQHL